MNSDRTKLYAFSAGCAFLLLFSLFFFVDFLKTPLPFGLKCADTKSIAYGPSHKDFKDHYSFYAQNKSKVKFKKGTLFMYLDTGIVKKQFCAKDTSIKKVLLIGDSQVEFLRSSVYNFCVNNNYELVASIAWYGSTTAAWASNDTITRYLETYKPDFVICALGLNEVLTPSVEPRRKYIQTIVKSFTDKHIPYYWIGPAAWTKDYGICKVMEEELDTLFYPSQKLVLDRAPDKRHPSFEASKVWFDSVSVSMEEYTPISFTKPVVEYKKPENSPFVALGRAKK